MHNWIHKGKRGGLHEFQCTECQRVISPFQSLGKYPQERVKALEKITLPCKQEKEARTPQEN